ncbi:MAG: hypothetical protein ACOH10_07915 [Rhodoglobus sp.]
MSLDLDAIRARCDRVGRLEGVYDKAWRKAAEASCNDIPDLLAEVERLEAGVERERAAYDALQHDFEVHFKRAEDLDAPCHACHELEAEQDAAEIATAWEAGHQHPWRRGPDDCKCGAWSRNECGCGKYGTGELLSLADNPYAEADHA